MARNQAPARSGSIHGSPSIRRGAKALVTSSDRCLLVRERHADGTPFWTLPGGGVHTHESPADALRRELAEELCCRCVVEDATAEFWYAHRSLDAALSRYTVFECSLLSDPTPDRTDGVLALRWVDPQDPPPATLPQVRAVVRNC